MREFQNGVFQLLDRITMILIKVAECIQYEALCDMNYYYHLAVQNKPLGLDVKNEVDHDDDENNENEGEVEKEEAVLSTGKTTSFPNGSANVGERPEILAEKRKADQRGIDKASSANLEQPNASRSRVDFSPLLNLHGDYDEDSLPSPTRDNAPPLPVLKPIGFGSGTAFNSHLVAPRNVQTENATLHPYVTDALKAVSSYQEKYGKNSILESTRLPSPTPSEDGNGGNDDINGEVSSSSGSHNARTVLPSTAANGMAPVNSSDGFQMQPVYSSAGPQMAQVRTIGQVGSEANPAVKASAKSRDPRLRFMKSETSVVPKNGFAAGPVNSLKHKSDDELVLDEHSLKRQRKDSMSSRDVKVTGSQSGATKDRNLVGTEVGYEMGLDADNNKLTVSSVPSTSISTTGPIVSLPSLLKGIAANPQMLVQLLRMEQQKIAAGQAQEKPDGQAVNGLSSATSSSSGIGQNPSVKSQMPPQTKSTNNNMAKIRMKPRDPRRVLHSNMAQRTENSGSATSNVHSIKDQLLHRKQGDQAQKLAVPLQSASLTDISQQFTKNLQNLADMVSKSQSKTSDDLTKPKNVPELCSQTDTKPAANPWGDVDHLLDGYDDKQKAAIQKERARRIEEQNKMFAARKLCLVLDLDHTLLNSAKFVEIDPIHEEILRKKEEQDRQTQERHLFRLQHMGMWTKLRPGIWTFLEKASQLYELHVYTMGNKLYATEMAKLLDPKGNLFAGRVLSRGDDGDPFDGDDRVPKSKDLDGVLGMESAVLIIDDSLRVWPHNKHNLIVVERYTYFPSSRRQFGLIGPSLLEIDHDERPEDGTLASSLAVIERIHEIFFSHSCLTEVDVRNILGAEQRKILAGCKIVFSRIFPVGEANPHLHPLWQTAEQFGAECTNQIDEQVTHVVANSLGTDKVNWALSTGRFVVHPGWVEASALLYRRANEQDFAVKTLIKGEGGGGSKLSFTEKPELMTKVQEILRLQYSSMLPSPFSTSESELENPELDSLPAAGRTGLIEEIIENLNELVRRNEEKREAVGELRRRIERLERENKKLKDESEGLKSKLMSRSREESDDCMVCAKYSENQSKSRLARLKRLMFGSMWRGGSN
ncbi:uncharacterized protein A4U43_C09F14730 [Asparagus officinalis]|uniref:protein-serine/threonine phosphatase n=1 Tax=Asparagus officinalis TaxID=4686 RepID=A0A5P1E7Q5_ASPOF|nr:uncharacterized protein A4U43_C09F14730 [Asparagus officinalis]